MQNKSEAKKAAVLRTGKKSKAPFAVALIAAAVLTAAGFILGAEKSPGPVMAKVAGASANGEGEFAYPVSDFTDGKARYFSYRSPSGLNIRYFIIRSSDGIIRAAFDSCDTCWASGKGYRQEGDFMVCNNCGQRFSSERINEVQGGCNPAPLTRTVKGDRVIVKVSDIVGEGSFYFDFGKRG